MATDPLMESMVENARQRFLTGNAQPNDELLLLIDHNGRQMREAITSASEETRKAIRASGEETRKCIGKIGTKRDTKELGAVGVGGMGLGASFLYFIRTFFI